MSKKIFKALSCLLVAVVLFLMVGSAPPVEAGVGCGGIGTWLPYSGICTSVERDCWVVCAK